MKILILEAFYGGSHQSFCDQLMAHSHHTYTLFSLPAKYWKWRMYGSAVTFAERFNALGASFDLILASDMMDLSLFLSLTRQTLSPTTKVALYFHENQLAYPWLEDSEDIREKRDVHYGMINYHSALAADFCLFNSDYNRTSFLDGLRTLLGRMPDARHDLSPLAKKSQVVPLGLELGSPAHGTRKSHPQGPLILWNHRWEHDKNPKDFFEALYQLDAAGYTFRLAVLGQSFKQTPPIFEEARARLKDHIIHFGYAPKDLYDTLLNAADLLPVTSHHDFFGISVMEAIHHGAFPLLPNRLAYPELYKPSVNPAIFYDQAGDLIGSLKEAMDLYPHLPTFSHLTKAYDWSMMGPYYDQLFDSFIKL